MSDEFLVAERSPRWPEGAETAPDAVRLGGAGEAMRAVSRLLGTGGGGPDAVRERLVEEARDFFGVSAALLLSPVELTAPPAATAGDDDVEARSVLLLPLRPREEGEHVLVLADEREREFSDEELRVAAAFAGVAAASLGQLQLAAEHAAQTAREAALARAAKTLNETLDLNRVLVRICEEAGTILDADYAAVYLGSRRDGLRTEAVTGLPAEAVGSRLRTGEGLAGKAVERDEPMLTNDYQAMPGRAESPMFDEVRSSMAVPMHWDGELRGVLSVDYIRPYNVTRDDLGLLEAFAELAAAACRNASAHAWLTLAARTDSLTGCLNHAALHDSLRRELERCRRTGHRLSLAIVDLDDFKLVNERYGHIAGDEVLRAVGHGLRQSVRPYDLVGRYGGDEFAVVALDVDEREAVEIISRGIAGLGQVVAERELPGGPARASAGVAEWEPDESPTALIERADQALLYAKQRGARGLAMRASQVPTGFLPSAPKRAEPAEDASLASPVREQSERLRTRTRQLALANALGTRLAAMTDPADIASAAVEELHRAFGYYLCAVIRIRDDGYVEGAAGIGEAFERLVEQHGWSQPREAGLIGRCLRERRPVVSGDVVSEPDYRPTEETATVRSELVVPVWVGGELWGAINVEEVRADAFDDDDVRLVQTVADQVGSALRSATLFERLEGAYLGTAEALAAALEAKDAWSGIPSRKVVENAEAVGRRLGMGPEELRSLRFGAIFRDIGKIAVPERILVKRGALTPRERAEMERHPVVGERILAPVDLLAEVRPLVRHAHERWDGGGYPDGLSGEEIPLGARVIFACDAFHAMTSERPYRLAMSTEEAVAELRRNAGTQFDPRVVEVLLEVLSEGGGPAEPQAALSDSR